jgi:RNase H-like domain found in reverse transcriptase
VLKLSVDTSYKAIGWYISVLDDREENKWHYARFGSTLMNECESRYSQPKRELFGLIRALNENRYLLLGARKLIVETDTKYLKGMLQNPGQGPNATINHWIKAILMYHFELQHIAGKTFAMADSLSRRPPQPTDEPTKPWDHSEKEHDGLLGYSKPNEDDLEPLSFEEFKANIDTQEGYLQKELQLVSMEVLPDKELKLDPVQMEPYPKEHRTGWATREDEQLEDVRRWLNPPWRKPTRFLQKQYKDLVAKARVYYLEGDKLYKRSIEGKNCVVVPKGQCMYIM